MKLKHSKIRSDLFTLIELLVVIAIISILAAILLPALKSARDRSKAIICSDTLNQMGKAQFCYASDHDGFPVIVWGQSSTFDAAGPPPDKYARWQELLSPYLGWNWDSEVDVWPQGGDPVFYCPSAAPRGRVSWGENIRNLLAYGINRMRSCYDFGPKRFANIPFQSKTLFNADLYDSGADPILDYPEVVSGKSWNGTHFKTTLVPFAWRHSGRLNVLFYDGHVDGRGPVPNPYDSTKGPIPQDIIF